MIVIDEYLAVRVVGGDWPDQLPDDDLALPASRHWRLLQRLHAAAIAARFGGGLLIAETLAAALVHGYRLFFGLHANVGRPLATAADELAIAVLVVP